MRSAGSTEAVPAGGLESPARSDVAFLLLDGLRRTRAGTAAEVALCALGLTPAGAALPLALRRVAVEDEAAWRTLLADLRADGIGPDLLLICSDGHPALVKAVHAVFSDVPQQISVAHRLLALARKVDARWRPECLGQARRIFAAPDRAAAIALFREWHGRWLKQGELAVRSLEADLASCLTFYRFPQHLWSRIRTVNLVERAFREARRASAGLPLAPIEEDRADRSLVGEGAHGENGPAPQERPSADGLGPADVAADTPPIPAPTPPGEIVGGEAEPPQDLSAITESPAAELEGAAASETVVADLAPLSPYPFEAATVPAPPLRLVELHGDEGFTQWLRAYREREFRTRIYFTLTSLAGLIAGIALSLGR